MERDIKGVWIPGNLWGNGDLSLMDKVFLVEINLLDGESGCYASNNHFSEFFGLSKTRCSTIIRDLRDKGYINIRYFYEDGKKCLERRIITMNCELPTKEGDSNSEPVKYIKRNVEVKEAEIEELEDIKVNNRLDEKEGASNSKLVKDIATSGEVSSSKDFKEVETNVEVKKIEIVKLENLEKVESLDVKVSTLKNAEYEEIVAYLNDKCKVNYKCETKKTISLIKARMKEGYDINDFKKVINRKANSWMNTPMRKYLRPETLFGNKFESYINESKTSNVGGENYEWQCGDSKDNREDKGEQLKKTSKWRRGSNIKNRGLTKEEREWAERELE